MVPLLLWGGHLAKASGSVSVVFGSEALSEATLGQSPRAAEEEFIRLHFCFWGGGRGGGGGFVPFKL